MKRARPILALALLASTVHAEPQQLFRVGTLCPEGSGWARELHAFIRDVDSSTNGRVAVKIYFGASAGDEPEQLDRIRRGQLDAIMGGVGCERIVPSLRLVRLPGLFQDRDEAAAIMNALHPQFEKEAAAAGFVMTGTTGLGPDVYFMMHPVHSMAELRSTKLWRWDIDEVGIATSRAMGLNIVPTEIAKAGQALTQAQVDGVTAIPLAALAWQWSARARYVTDLRGSYLWGCMLVKSSAFDRMLPGDRAAFRAAAAQLSLRMELIGRQQDEELLSGKYRVQGAIPVPVSKAFRAEYFDAAREARERLGERYVSRELLDRVLRMLADYRAQHAASGQPR
jgi:TRAP-type C4-dicarboxylate transport system substrate-binding protein